MALSPEVLADSNLDPVMVEQHIHDNNKHMQPGDRQAIDAAIPLTDTILQLEQDINSINQKIGNISTILSTVVQGG